MAQVFQCDACKKVSTLAGNITVGDKKYGCCNACVDRVNAVLHPKPRGPKPAETEET